MKTNNRSNADNLSVVIVVPVYRDWASCSVLCRFIDEACAANPESKVRMLLVDDGSPGGLEQWEPFVPQHLQSIEILRLRRNVGHQRAIAIGLCHVHQNVQCDAVVVMDGDGEDRPSDAIRLIQQASRQPRQIFFAERRKRFESFTFRVGYWLYRMLHLVLTAVPVRVGNFSIVPFSALGCLVCMPELWNHYAGAVFKSKLPFQSIPMDRGNRYHGQSQMNLIALVNHGLAGIATFHDAVATRILVAQMFAMLVVLATLVGVITIRVFTNLAIPGWATYTAGLLLVLLSQLVAVSFSLVFSLITNRTANQIVPMRDYVLFVESVGSLWSGTIETTKASLYR